MNKYYITTAIPYVNGEPHIGFAMELVMADVLARYARKTFDQVLFSTGTDEHGGKIGEKAEELGITPQELADKNSQLFIDLTKKLNISNDFFVRTTDKEHIKGAQHAWKLLEKEIYKSKYKGWYCLGDEAFFTETEVKANNGICPNHNRPYELIEEENYFFPLSKYTARITQAITSSKFKIYPETRKNEILSLLKGGLDDISISRPKKTTPWGIDVPGDSSQTMYVWFEAVLNYLTVLGYPDGKDFKEFWPPNVQVLGKDIIRFHAAILPAILMALNLELADSLFVHGFINVDGQKMSKSLDNQISPDDIVGKYGSDAFRYFFIRHVPSYDDGNFTWETFKASYNQELANELGNALSRTLSMVIRYLDGEVKPKEAKFNTKELDQHTEVFKLDKALEFIWSLVKDLNRTIDEDKPWEVAKQAKKTELESLLNGYVGKLLAIADLLEPFLPDSSLKIKKALSGNKLAPMSSTLFPRLDEDD